MSHLPSPPPRRRIPGLSPARRTPSSTSERVRGMVREHEEEERPFDPERRGTWRGTRPELVVNPADFERDLRELVDASKLAEPDEAFEKAKVLLEEGGRPSHVMDELDELLETHGVEAYPSQSMSPRYLYLNTGDTYNATLIYDSDENKYFVSTFGDIVEEEEPRQFDEAWDEWIRRDVEEAVRGEIENDLDLADPEKDKLLERFEDFDDDDLKRIFRDSVGDVRNAEISTESDGSIFVHKMKEVCAKTAEVVFLKLGAMRENARVEKFGAPDRRTSARVTIRSVEYEKDANTGEWTSYQGGHMGRVTDPEFERELDEMVERSPNAGGSQPMTAEEFMAALRADADLQGRALRMKFSPSTGQLFVNYFNLPDENIGEGRPSSGAEAENNRQMFTVSGFSTGRTGAGLGVPGPAPKVRVEHVANALGRDYRLRGKSGPPAQVARYLAQHLTKIAAEVPPNYTHSRAPNARGKRRGIIYRVRGTADDHRDQHMKFGYSHRTLTGEFSTEPEAMRQAESFMRGQAPAGRAAKVWIEKSWPSGDFSVLGKWVGENGRWVSGHR